MHLDPCAFVASPEIVERLEEKSTKISCIEEKTLFTEKEESAGLYVVQGGSVSLSLRTLAGKELDAVMAAPGSLLGLPVLIAGESFVLAATAHAGADLGYISRDEFIAIMRDDPQLALGILEVLAGGFRSVQNARRTLES